MTDWVRGFMSSGLFGPLGLVASGLSGLAFPIPPRSEKVQDWVSRKDVRERSLHLPKSKLRLFDMPQRLKGSRGQLSKVFTVLRRELLVEAVGFCTIGVSLLAVLVQPVRTETLRCIEPSVTSGTRLRIHKPSAASGVAVLGRPRTSH